MKIQSSCGLAARLPKRASGYRDAAVWQNEEDFFVILPVLLSIEA